MAWITISSLQRATDTWCCLTGFLWTSTPQVQPICSIRVKVNTPWAAQCRLVFKTGYYSQVYSTSSIVIFCKVQKICQTGIRYQVSGINRFLFQLTLSHSHRMIIQLNSAFSSGAQGLNPTTEALARPLSQGSTLALASTQQELTGLRAGCNRLSSVREL